MFLSRRDIAVLATAGFMALGTGVIGGEPAKEKPAKSAVIRDGYETGPPTWQREYTDATMRLIAHERSDQAARSGRLSERFLFESGPGSKFFVSQVLPNIPVSEDLGLSLYVRSNQAGAQLFAWVVLPADIDPDTRVPSYVLVPGTIFNRPDRWEKLELVEMLPAIEEQARLLRASTRRQVPLQGAYIARVVVNLMGGQGQSDVFLDDLQVGPVSPETLAAWEAGRSQTGPELAGVAGNSARKVARKGRGEDDSSLPPIKFTRGVLEKLRGEREYAPWFPMAIDAPGANPLELRRRGFDVLVTDDRPDPKAVGPAVERGMLLLPRLSGATEDDGIERVLAAMAAYPFPGSVLLWSIGEHLGSQRDIAARMKEVDHVRGVVAAIHESDEELHLATARVDGEFRLYSRTPAGLDVIGLDLPIWGTSVPPIEGLHYLNQAPDAHGPEQSGSVVLGMGSGEDPRRGNPECLGRRRSTFLGPPARPARAGPDHDLHGAGRRMPRPVLRRRRRLNRAGRRSLAHRDELPQRRDRLARGHHRPEHRCDRGIPGPRPGSCRASHDRQREHEAHAAGEGASGQAGAARRFDTTEGRQGLPHSCG